VNDIDRAAGRERADQLRAALRLLLAIHKRPPANHTAVVVEAELFHDGVAYAAYLTRSVDPAMTVIYLAAAINGKNNRINQQHTDLGRLYPHTLTFDSTVSFVGIPADRSRLVIEARASRPNECVTWDPAPAAGSQTVDDPLIPPLRRAHTVLGRFVGTDSVPTRPDDSDSDIPPPDDADAPGP
jgi:hypothetical protein